jgi:hypothetical protein
VCRATELDVLRAGATVSGPLADNPRIDDLISYRNGGKGWLVIPDEIEQSVSEYSSQRIDIRAGNVLIFLTRMCVRPVRFGDRGPTSLFMAGGVGKDRVLRE